MMMVITRMLIPSSLSSLLLLFLFLTLVISAPSSTSNEQQLLQRQTYIVYLGEHGGVKVEEQKKIQEQHHSFLLSVKDSEEDARRSLVYSYDKVIDGFSAVLSAEEADQLSEMEDVISVFPARKFSLHTTRSWEFMKDFEGLVGQERELLPSMAKRGTDIVVGVLDSGIWPESESFSDEGLGPIPPNWKGICQQGDSFTSSHCNRKIIGARYYLNGYERQEGPLNTSYAYSSPRDHDGHGTHTASTAAGRAVPNASQLGGFASGMATGGAPLARIAIYKVCWPLPGPNPNFENVCYEDDMLKAIDQALHDGVHVLSISIGARLDRSNYTTDGISLGALHAIKRNVVVACSAGNDGPYWGTVVNLAPWLITVAASSIDRRFPSPLVLGNGKTVKGETVTTYHLRRKKNYPLIFAGDAEIPGNGSIISGQCLPGSLSPEKVRGKIVLCLRGSGSRVKKGEEVLRAGGAGFILGNGFANGKELTVDSHILPATAVAHDDAVAILSYINSTSKPKARFIPAMTATGVKPDPFMASFTSRGPNPVEPNILKPDITAPGLNILAAWSGVIGPTKLSSDHRVVEYNIYSGTSMACPHVTATAVLLRSIHPTWSSAAIRSAMMTTASIVNDVGGAIRTASGEAASPLEMGSGHLRPTNAIDPGLVYNATYMDYVLFGCASVKHSYDKNIPCPKDYHNLPKPYDLNHPSVAIGNLNGVVTLKRTVTNVGSGKAVYKVAVVRPPGISVDISPDTLSFSSCGEERSFDITVEADGSRSFSVGDYSYGMYTWVDGVHTVRSPILLTFS